MFVELLGGERYRSPRAESRLRSRARIRISATAETIRITPNIRSCPNRRDSRVYFFTSATLTDSGSWLYIAPFAASTIQPRIPPIAMLPHTHAREDDARRFVAFFRDVDDAVCRVSLEMDRDRRSAAILDRFVAAHCHGSIGGHRIHRD